MLNNIRIILTEPSHPGNIGAAARAMKTMALHRLYLVAPKFFPDAKATVRASGAEDILANTVVTSSLIEALEGCTLIIGTSARARTLAWEILDPTGCAHKVLQEATNCHQVAIVFGRERIGLTNEELALCHFQVCIPTNPDFASLNLGASVQLIAYEIYKAYGLSSSQAMVKTQTALADGSQMDSFYDHLERIMIATEFLNPSEPKKLMLRLKRLFARSRPTKQEINILRGILTAVQKKMIMPKN